MFYAIKFMLLFFSNTETKLVYLLTLLLCKIVFFRFLFIFSATRANLTTLSENIKHLFKLNYKVQSKVSFENSKVADGMKLLGVTEG